MDKRHLKLVSNIPDAQSRAAAAAAAAAATDPNYLKSKWDKLYPGWNLSTKGDTTYEVVEQRTIWNKNVLLGIVHTLRKVA
jgi:hypothetical protein